MVFLAIALAFLSLAVAAALCGSLLTHPPSGLVRTNFRGSEVAVVGAAIGLIVGALWEGRLGPALLDAGILALSANFVNLLDLRPGRASKGFLPAWVVLAYFAWGSAYVVLSLPVAAAALLWLAPDLGERGMLGDAGANLLGAVLGAGAGLSLGVPGPPGVLGGLVVLTLEAEGWSLSRPIDATRPLSW